VPLIYVPGDNEWTDCRRLAAGGFDPVERLQKLRELFFADAALARTERRWRSNNRPAATRSICAGGSGPVLFVSLNVPGPNNQFRPSGHTPATSISPATRRSSNGCGRDLPPRRREQSAGVVIVMQANPASSTTPPA
jgi:hypothetical protein